MHQNYYIFTENKIENKEGIIMAKLKECKSCRDFIGCYEDLRTIKEQVIRTNIRHLKDFNRECKQCKMEFDLNEPGCFLIYSDSGKMYILGRAYLGLRMELMDYIDRRHMTPFHDLLAIGCEFNILMFPLKPSRFKNCDELYDYLYEEYINHKGITEMVASLELSKVAPQNITAQQCAALRMEVRKLLLSYPDYMRILELEKSIPDELYMDALKEKETAEGVRDSIIFSHEQALIKQVKDALCSKLNHNLFIEMLAAIGADIPNTKYIEWLHAGFSVDDITDSFISLAAKNIVTVLEGIKANFPAWSKEKEVSLQSAAKYLLIFKNKLPIDFVDHRIIFKSGS